MALAETKRALEAAYPEEPERVAEILKALDVVVANDLLRESEQESGNLRGQLDQLQAEHRSLLAIESRNRQTSHATRRLCRLIETDPDFAREAEERLRKADREAARAGRPRSKVQDRKRKSHQE